MVDVEARPRPIIVMGCPRSGTTMVQLMLHTHRRLAIPPETRFVLEGYAARRSFGDLQSEENRRALARWIVDREGSRFGDLGLDRDVVHDRLVAGPPTLGSAFGAVFGAYAERFGKPRWGDKRPAYAVSIPRVLALFPDAQFLHVVRDGRDCVASLLGMPWHHGGLVPAVAVWARSIDHGRWAARALGPATYHEIRYEDLVADPEPVLRGVCSFLGERYEPAMTEPHKKADEAVPEYKGWHERTHRPVGEDRIGRWEGSLDREQLALCEAVLGSRLEAKGYELSGVDRPSWSALLDYRRRTARHLLSPASRRWIRLRHRLPGARPVADLGSITRSRARGWGGRWRSGRPSTGRAVGLRGG